MKFTKAEYLLQCLAEECIDVAHAISRCQRFGLNVKQAGINSTCKEQLAMEVSGMLAIVELICEEPELALADVFSESDDKREQAMVDKKKSAVLAMIEESRRLGRIA